MSDEESLAAAIYEEVSLSDYDPAWMDIFEAERLRLFELVPNDFIAIEHIGSTAVPRLAAKHIVDIMAGIESMGKATEIVELLCENGYTTSKDFNDSLTDRKWLMRWENGQRTHHLHIVVHGAEPWNERVSFRDALRRDLDLAAQYTELKRHLAKEHADDREGYTAAKTDFVRSVVQAELKRTGGRQ